VASSNPSLGCLICRIEVIINRAYRLRASAIELVCVRSVDCVLAPVTLTPVVKYLERFFYEV
jgi:hypothetical protein